MGNTLLNSHAESHKGDKGDVCKSINNPSGVMDSNRCGVSLPHHLGGDIALVSTRAFTLVLVITKVGLSSVLKV